MGLERHNFGCCGQKRYISYTSDNASVSELWNRLLKVFSLDPHLKGGSSFRVQIRLRETLVSWRHTWVASSVVDKQMGQHVDGTLSISCHNYASPLCTYLQKVYFQDTVLGAKGSVPIRGYPGLISGL